MREVRRRSILGVGLPLAQRDPVMVIPRRDWLLLRGRMRAVAKISVLPVLLKTAAISDAEGREGTDSEPEDKPRAADT
jgi:hypothetical protein